MNTTMYIQVYPLFQTFEDKQRKSNACIEMYAI